MSPNKQLRFLIRTVLPISNETLIFVTMSRIISHIEKLLLKHDCVIVPHIGGFVLQHIPAHYEKDEQIFYSEQKEIVFNRELQHNDGLLSESYIQFYHTDYKHAQSMLLADCDELLDELREKRTADLGELGSFSMEEDNKIIFHPKQSKLFNAENFGLQPFSIPTLEVLLSNQSDNSGTTKLLKSKDTLYIPINRRFIEIASACVVAILLFFVISTPIKEVNPAAYTASIIPTEFEKNTITKGKTETNTIATGTNTPSVQQKTAKGLAPQTATAVKVSSGTSQKTYYIIIGSLTSAQLAERQLKSIDTSFSATAGIVERDNKFRIYANKFDNRKDAENYLATIRRDSRYQTAWLFIAR